MRECSGICHRFKVPLIRKPVYKHQTYCRECEVYYPLSIRTCPCCKCMCRTTPVKKKPLYNSYDIISHGELSVFVVYP